MSKSRSHISNTLRLLTLPEDVIAMLGRRHSYFRSGKTFDWISQRNIDRREIVSKNYSARKIEHLVKSRKVNKSIEKFYDADTARAQERIEKILGLKVNIINKKNNSGKITIEYKNLDQFELLSDLLTKK